jgi:hypothetical protein
MYLESKLSRKAAHSFRQVFGVRRYTSTAARKAKFTIQREMAFTVGSHFRVYSIPLIKPRSMGGKQWYGRARRSPRLRVLGGISGASTFDIANHRNSII